MSRTKNDCDLRSNRGFTLIELLVVIAVIAVVLAILFPSLRAVRRSAKLVVCSSNLRQISLAWNLYLNDFDERFYQGVNANFKYGGWMGLKRWLPRPLNAYTEYPIDANNASDAKVFRCPADRGGIPPLNSRFYNEAYEVHGNSYQTNIFLVGQTRCGKFSDETSDLDTLMISPRLPEQSRKRAYKPGALLFLGDFGWINQWKPKLHPNEVYKTQAEWHGREDHHNMAFLDGHVAFLKIHKGVYVHDKYHVLPFKDLFHEARKVQWTPND